MKFRKTSSFLVLAVMFLNSVSPVSAVTVSEKASSDNSVSISSSLPDPIVTFDTYMTTPVEEKKEPLAPEDFEEKAREPLVPEYMEEKDSSVLEEEEKSSESNAGEGNSTLEEETQEVAIPAVTGTWGNSPVSFSGDTLTISAGEIGAASQYPTAIAPKASVKTIVFQTGVKFPAVSSDLFRGFPNLVTMSGLNTVDTSKATGMLRMFKDSPKLASADFSNFNTSNVMDMGQMFQGCAGLKTLNLSSFKTSKVISMAAMFEGCTSLGSVNVSSFDTSKVTGLGQMFEGCKSLTSLNVSNFNTSNVINSARMFSGCSALTSLDVSGFDTSKMNSMFMMFAGCSSLTSLNVSDFDTSGVTTTMAKMFQGTTALKTLDVSEFNTSKVVSMGGMFANSGVTSLNLMNFNTANAIDMSEMFSRCTSLTSLDISSFDTSKVTTMQDMFTGTTALNNLKLGSNFKFVGGETANLPLAPSDTTYAGKWINLAGGTASLPKGVNIWTAPDFMNKYTGNEHADTYVWQPYGGMVKVRYLNVNDESEAVFDDVAYTDYGMGDSITLYKHSDTVEWKFVESESDPSPKVIRFNDTDQTVTYRYRKAQGGDVTVRYVERDRDGAIKDIDADKYNETLKGKIGDEYETEEKAIEGYTFSEKTDNWKGQFEEDPQSVIYTYERNGPDYIITVPAAIEFEPGTGESVDAHVDMYELDGKTAYTGDGTANVSVSSANDFKLKHEDSTVNEELPYFLVYNTGGILETGNGTTPKDIGSYSKSYLHNEGKARLKKEGTFKGLYFDTLTYTITDTTEAK